MIFTTALVVAAAAVGSSAQGLSGLSASCQAAGAAILTGPAGTCLGVAGLVNVAMTNSSQSLVSPINSWLTSTCAQPACTNGTIDSALGNITSGCSTDLSTAGITSGTWSDISDYVKEWYSVGRQVACLKEGNDLCVTKTLQAIENWVGQPLSKNTIQTIIPKLIATGTEVPSNLTCTDCTHAAYSLIRPHLSESQRGTWDSYVSGQCGSSGGYTDGTTPAGIVQSANAAIQGSSNGAISSFGAWSTTALLAGVASIAALAL
ncbi:hypothetical protein ACGC1H_003958 [Rhizoctonia solani]|uniref:Uncharacterized protein n=1 Tax=Rhizoctonia solani TaxID=456999 RepID=A0A8H3GX25_9AGAM|nr:unnamed protein product [Rhizoctonia solani]